MKSLPFVIACLLLPYLLLAQTISGTVYSEGTDNVVTNASVYYSGSTVGTTTNNSGEFRLPAKSGQVPLVISCVGYQSAEVSNYKPNEPLKIHLKPKQFELEEVVVTSGGMSREEKVRIFIREFIGTSKFAKSCTVLNMDDVDLYYNLKTKTLIAECSKPILIQNKMLGYTISYYLDRFKHIPDGVQYAGNFIFTEIPVQARNKNANKNREEAYQGSRMQLIRFLWQRDVKNDIFKIYNHASKPITADKVVIDSAGQRYLHLTNRIWVSQQSYKALFISWITPAVTTSFINKEGFYGLGIKWAGHLSRQRIGDMLPFEYQSLKERKQ